MSQPAQDELAKRVRIMQIILLGMVLGPLAFLVIAVIVRTGATAPNPPIFSYIALGVALVLAVAHYVVRDRVETLQRQQIAKGVPDPQSAWYAAFGSSFIAGIAVLEAAAFLLTIAYLIEGNLPENWGLCAAAAGFIAFMATLWPTRGRVERWIKEQQQKARS